MAPDTYPLVSSVVRKYCQRILRVTRRPRCAVLDGVGPQTHETRPLRIRVRLLGGVSYVRPDVWMILYSIWPLGP